MFDFVKITKNGLIFIPDNVKEFLNIPKQNGVIIFKKDKERLYIEARKLEDMKVD